MLAGNSATPSGMGNTPLNTVWGVSEAGRKQGDALGTKNFQEHLVKHLWLLLPKLWWLSNAICRDFETKITLGYWGYVLAFGREARSNVRFL